MAYKVIKKAAAYVLSTVLAFGAFSAIGIGVPVEVQAARKKVKTIKFKKKGYVLSKKGKKISLSKQLVFNPKKTNSKKVSYKTSSKKIATVSSKGVVKAKKNGTVTITATSKSNKKAKATTKVTVGKIVKTLKFKEGTRRTVKATERFYLHPVYSPSNAATKSVTYKSSNTRVATVSSKGYVTAKAAGTAKITATCKDAYGKSASINITVPPYVTGVSLDYAKLHINKGEADKNLTAAVKGSSSGVTYKWTSSNDRVAKVIGSGKTVSIKAVDVGSAVIRVEAYNSNNAVKNHKFASCTLNVEKIPDQIISAGGAYDYVRKNITVTGSTTGTVNINDANIDTLTLQPGNYTVNLNDCNIKKLVSNETDKSGMKPTINVNGTTVKNTELFGEANFNLKDEESHINNLTMYAGGTKLTTEKSAVFKNVTISFAEPTEISADIDKLTITKDSEVTVRSEVETILLDCKQGKPVLNIASGARVYVIKVSEYLTQGKIFGEGNVGEIQVSALDNIGDGKIDVDLDEGAVVEDSKGNTIILQSYEAVEKQVDQQTGLTKIILSTDAYKYRLTKGGNTTYVTKDSLDKMFNYLSNPSEAYNSWLSHNGTYTDASGVVTVKTDNNDPKVKIITIKGTASRDGDYKVTLEEITSGTNYKATVTYMDSSRDDSIVNISVSNGIVTAESSKYKATAKTDGTEFKMVNKISNKTLVEASKGDDGYKVFIENSRAKDLTVAQQIKK